ncbi:MAG: radical SAM protein [Theionarchaea archaeon]|nr:radical SAM protein [Theionarchaea archaeon]
MKTLLIRPGPEIVEKTLFGPWEPELAHLGKLYKEAGGLYRFLCMFEMVSPTPLLAVGSWLKELGEEVEVLDIPIHFGLPLREKGNKKRREEFFHFFEHADCDVVGISCTSTFESLASVRVAGIVKKANPDIKVMLGGYQGAVIADELMKQSSAIDVIVLSDFEPIAEELMNAFKGRIPLRDVPNLVYRENGDIKRTNVQKIKVDLDQNPYYDFSIVEQYLPNYIMYSIEASRGCPYHCSYCQERIFRSYHAVKGAERAVDELIEAANVIASVNNMAFFYYSDPLWGLKRSWVREFCTVLIERRDEIKAKHFGWFMCTRFGMLKDKEFELLKNAGCATIGYGIESLSPKMLKLMGRSENQKKYLQQVQETIGKTLNHDIQLYISMILGMPGETPETLKETVEGLKKLPIDNELLHIFTFLAYPLPKTVLEEQLTDETLKKELGVHLWAEPDWRKGYFPKLTPLYDPSDQLSVQELTEFYLDLSEGKYGIPIFHKKLEILKGVRGLLSKEEISPEDYLKWAKVWRRMMTTLTG